MLTPTKPVKSCECSGSCGDCCCCTKESIGLGNVDNTSDLNKPLSTDMVNALSGKVGLDVFTQLKNRVLALENSIPDITSLENRVTNAEANIVTLQSNYANLSQAISNLTATVNTLSGRVTSVNDALVTVGTRVDALEDKDSNNVKLTGVSEQTIQGSLKANNPVNGATDKTLVTANWVSQTGDSSPNNIVHKNGSETIDGDKRFIRSLIARGTTQYYSNFWLQNMSIDRSVYDGTRREIQLSFRDMNGQALGGLILVRKTASTEIIARVFKKDGSYVDATLISVTETP